jgi:hypothetical protein
LASGTASYRSCLLLLFFCFFLLLLLLLGSTCSHASFTLSNPLCKMLWAIWYVFLGWWLYWVWFGITVYSCELLSK